MNKDISEGRDRNHKKMLTQTNSCHDNSDILTNTYNLKNILAYNQHIQEKEYEEQRNNIFPSVLISVRKSGKESTKDSNIANSNRNPTHCSSVRRTNTRKSTSISRDGKVKQVILLDRSQKKEFRISNISRADIEQFAAIPVTSKYKKPSNALKITQLLMNRESMEDSKYSIKNIEKQHNHIKRLSIGN